jgi:hypothetical protein
VQPRAFHRPQLRSFLREGPSSHRRMQPLANLPRSQRPQWFWRRTWVMVKPTSFRLRRSEQTLLLPPSQVDWLPANHLVIFLCQATAGFGPLATQNLPIAHVNPSEVATELTRRDSTGRGPVSTWPSGRCHSKNHAHPLVRLRDI